jgi:urease beta subunit
MQNGAPYQFSSNGAPMIPGEYILASGDIEANVGRATARVTVANTADRPIQVGSHFHFFEVNRALRFDRSTAYGMRLAIPAGTAVRFEPGEEKEVNLVALGGLRIVYGMNSLVMGSLDASGAKEAALEKAKTEGYLEVQS